MGLFCNNDLVYDNVQVSLNFRLIHVIFHGIALLHMIQPPCVSDLFAGHLDEGLLLLLDHALYLVSSVLEVEVVSSLLDADGVVNLDNILALKRHDGRCVPGNYLAHLSQTDLGIFLWVHIR